jgi:hypothetical protein
MENRLYFRRKAEQCRRLAAYMTVENDKTAASLKAMAIEFDAMAAAADVGSDSRLIRDHVRNMLARIPVRLHI